MFKFIKKILFGEKQKIENSSIFSNRGKYIEQREIDNTRSVFDNKPKKEGLVCISGAVFTSSVASYPDVIKPIYTKDDK